MMNTTNNNNNVATYYNINKPSLSPGVKLRLHKRKLIVKKLLGIGAYAEVYKVEDKSGNIFAMKKYRKMKKYIIRSAQVEIEMLSKISHPNIIGFHDYYFSKGSILPNSKNIYVLLDFCDDNLISLMRYYIDRKEIFPIPSVLNVLKDITSAISYLHFFSPSPIIHRDVKLDNVLIKDSRYILCDFGSCIESPVILSAVNWNKITTEISLYTTPDYRSPEMLQLFTYKKIDTKTDIWTLGCMAFMLIFYRPPFHENLNNIVTGELYLPDINCPVELLFIICSCLKVNPEHRPNIYQICSLIAKMLDIVNYVENKYNSELIDFPPNLTVDMFAKQSKYKHRRAISNLPSVPVEILNEKLSTKRIPSIIQYSPIRDDMLQSLEDMNVSQKSNITSSTNHSDTPKRSSRNLNDKRVDDDISIFNISESDNLNDAFRMPNNVSRQIPSTLRDKSNQLKNNLKFGKSIVTEAKRSFISHKKSGSSVKLPHDFDIKKI